MEENENVEETEEIKPPSLVAFFDEIDKREGDIAELRTEVTACFDAYCSSTGTDKDALKLAYKLYKQLNKDKHKAETMQFEYDKMAELLIPPGERWKQEPLL